MKARITKSGSTRSGIPVGTVIEFDENLINCFGCVTAAVIIKTGRVIGSVSLDLNPDEENPTAEVIYE